MILNWDITNMQNKQKIFENLNKWLINSILGDLGLSHQSECVGTKISSVTG